MERPFENLLLQRCNELALRGEGRTGTNPMVGAVVSKDRNIIGEGWHKEFGGPHAEINALRACPENVPLEDAVISVSLEPCNHRGKTPPCTQAILNTEIQKIAVDQIDPNIKMSGQSLKLLKDAGREVPDPEKSPLGAAVLFPFETGITKKRPYITIKMAVSRDSFIGQKGGQVKISGALSDRWVHRLRQYHQAIMVGTQTILNDNPSLTARYHNTHQPVRIIPDRNGLLPKSLKIFRVKGENLILSRFPGEYPNSRTICTEDFDLPNLLNSIYQAGIGTMMVEGGSKLVSSFLQLNLWDSLIIIRSRQVQLGEGIRAPEFPSISPYEQRILGEDVWNFIKWGITR